MGNLLDLDPSYDRALPGIRYAPGYPCEEGLSMPRAIMVVYSDPADPSHEEEYRAWYDHHIAAALKAVPGMPRAVRYKLSARQGHPIHEPFRHMTIYEIETDDVDALHRRLSEAWDRGELPQSDIITPGPVVYWDFDSEITT
jgi:hypothetical protein